MGAGHLPPFPRRCIVLILHAVIKTRFTNLGYLPNHPYHLVSDEEMFNAFIHNDVNYFDDMYPCKYESLQGEYDILKENIIYHIDAFLADSGHTYTIPEWIYSYMLGTVVTYDSDQKERHDLLVLSGLDNIEDELTEASMKFFLDTSKKWISKLTTAKREHRPPTIFGEPHVIKSLRLQQ